MNADAIVTAFFLVVMGVVATVGLFMRFNSKLNKMGQGKPFDFSQGTGVGVDAGAISAKSAARLAAPAQREDGKHRGAGA